MHRLKVVRVKNRNEPRIDLSLLNGIAPADAETFEYADYDQWEQYLKGIEVELGKVILIGFNDGDVDVIIANSEGWLDAVDDLRRWLDEFPSGGNYEIYWKFNGGSVRRYSKDF